MYYITYNTLSTPSTLAGTQFIHVFYFFWLFQHAYNESIILHALYFQLLQHTQYYSISISFLALLRSLGIQIGRDMDRSFTGGLRGMALSTRQYVVARSQPPLMMNWIPGRKLFFSPPLPGTHQMTFTMVMKLPCFTNCCHTELTALMVTSMQALQNVKTD